MAKRKRKPRRTEFDDAFRLNELTFAHYYDQLCELAMNMFDWQHIPDTVDARYLELTLLNEGMALWFRDDVIGDLALRTMIDGRWNVYNIPTGRTAYGDNGYQARRTIKDSVIIWNNALRRPITGALQMYAWRLAELERTVDVNVRGQKTPKILLCDENQRLTLENFYMKYAGNYPFIFGDSHLNMGGLTTVDTTSPFVADKLQIVKRQIWNEALTYLGIENNSNEKAERLVTNESMSNLGAIQAQRLTRLNARQRACEEINRMFGLDIWCEYKVPLSTEIMAQQGGETDGELHDGGTNDM